VWGIRWGVLMGCVWAGHGLCVWYTLVAVRGSWWVGWCCCSRRRQLPSTVGACCATSRQASGLLWWLKPWHSGVLGNCDSFSVRHKTEVASGRCHHVCVLCRGRCCVMITACVSGAALLGRVCVCILLCIVHRHCFGRVVSVWSWHAVGSVASACGAACCCATAQGSSGCAPTCMYHTHVLRRTYTRSHVVPACAGQSGSG
jgi:hypothetical protein